MNRVELRPWRPFGQCKFHKFHGQGRFAFESRISVPRNFVRLVLNEAFEDQRVAAIWTMSKLESEV